MKTSNVKVVAITNKNNRKHFDVFLILSGGNKREYIMTYHTKKNPLFKILKDGMSLEEFKRVKANRLLNRYDFHVHAEACEKMTNSIIHLRRVIQSVLCELEEEGIKYA